MSNGLKHNWKALTAAGLTLATVAAGLVWSINAGILALRDENRLLAQQQSANSLADEIKDTVFERYHGVARSLAEDPILVAVAAGKRTPDDSDALIALNAVRRALRASLVYVLDAEGNTVACTPYDNGQTLTGKNYAFRPYFTACRNDNCCIYPAVGVTTGVPGLYVSAPIHGPKTSFAGAVVIKATFDHINTLIRKRSQPAVLVSPDGIVLSTNQPDWLYRAALPISPHRRDTLIQSRQFASEPLTQLPITLHTRNVKLQGNTYSVVRAPVAESGWQVFTLGPTDVVYPLTAWQKRLLTLGVSFIAVLLGIMSLLGINVVRRRRAEAALRRVKNALEVRVAERTHELGQANDVLKAEVHRRATIEDQLRASERRLADIIDFLPDATLAIDVEGRVTAWNQAMEALTGIPADEMLGKNNYEYAVPFYGDRRAVLLNHVLEPDQSIAANYPTIEKKGDTFTAEAVAPALPQGPTVVWVVAKRLYDADGRVIGAIESIRDVTQRKHEEAQLQHAKDTAEAATQAKSNFLANMSHEIRTPMTAILGFAEMLAEQCERTCTFGCASFDELIRTIRRNGDHLLQIINDILDLSRVEAGQVELERTACNPLELLEEVRSLMQPRASAKNLRFEVTHSAPLPQRIQTDPTRLRQILVNLVGNAIKFTEAGGVRVRVRQIPASNTSQYSRIQFDVIDTGIGLAPDQVTRLFQPFSQADSSTTRQFGGTGLGLAISKRLAKLLGGDITVRSKSHWGSRFRVQVRAGSSEESAFIAEPPPTPVPTVAPQEPGEGQPLNCRILLAEDGPDNQRLISLLLQRAGATVQIADNGQEAVHLALQSRASDAPFDLIFMDMQMPVMDGYEAVRALRQEKWRGPIVALTAHAMEPDRERCLRVGCDDHASKPINRRQLIELARRHTTPTPATAT